MKRVLMIAGALMLPGVPLLVTAQSMPAMAQAAALADGEVVKIDESANKITIKHGPIKKLGMDEGMTMVFRAQEPAMLKTAKPGEKVKFDVERINGQFTVTKIEKAR